MRARSKAFFPLLNCQFLTLGLSKRLHLLNKDSVKLSTFSNENFNADELAPEKKHN